MHPLIIALGVFLSLVIVLVLLRAKTGDRFEVKNSEIILALIPVALWLFLTGQIKEFAFGDLKLVSAIEQASSVPVEHTVSKLPVETIQTAMKGGVGEIPSLVASKAQALGFQLGRGGYWGPAIREYLTNLSASPAFRYLVVYQSDGTLFGLADGRQVAAMTGTGVLDAQRLAEWLNNSNTEPLRGLPGFIAAADALKTTDDTRTALQRMNTMDVQALPVVDDNGRLTGIVDRSKLSASMLIEIADRVERGS